MSFQQSSPPKAATLLAGIAMGESPRWHDNRLWLSDWGLERFSLAMLSAAARSCSGLHLNSRFASIGFRMAAC